MGVIRGPKQYNLDWVSIEHSPDRILNQILDLDLCAAAHPDPLMHHGVNALMYDAGCMDV